MWQLYLLIHLKMSNERILTSIFDSFYPRCLEVTKMHYSLSWGYWDTTYIGKSYPLLKLWQFGRWTKKKKKIFVFFGTKFCCQKNNITGFQKFLLLRLIFPVDLKYVIWFCLAFWEMEESICIYSGSEEIFCDFLKV